MAANQSFDTEVYAEGDYVDYTEHSEDDEGLVEEVEVDDESDDGEVEIVDEADDEEEGGDGGEGGEGQGQMLYIPGLGYIPLSSLGNIPGLNVQRGPAAVAPAAPVPEGVREWEQFSDFPHVTQESLLDLFTALQEDGKNELTVMMLGKGGVGKSSTTNSLVNDRVANVLAFQADNSKPMVYSRSIEGFTLNVIDTPSLLDQDTVSDARLEAIGRAVKDRPIDVILFLDRLDNYAVDTLDQSIINSISRVFGADIWQCAVIGLTRASESSVPEGVDFETFAAKRSSAIAAAIAKSGYAEAPVIPVALIENNSQCEQNADGEKIVPPETPWLTDLMEKATELALNAEPWEYDPKRSSKSADPNKKRRWLIPVALAVQVGLKLLLDRVMDDDGCRGDNNGPFDAQTVKERRAELKSEREKEKQRKQKQQQRAAASAPSSSGQVVRSSALDDFDSYDEEDYTEDE